MSIDSIVPMALAAATWAISGIITVTWMKAQMREMENKLKDIDRHLEFSDLKMEKLRDEFNDHRVEMAKQATRRANGG